MGERFNSTQILRVARFGMWFTIILLLTGAAISLNLRLTVPAWLSRLFWIACATCTLVYVSAGIAEGFSVGMRQASHPEAPESHDPRSRFDLALAIVRGYMWFGVSLGILLILALLVTAEMIFSLARGVGQGLLLLPVSGLFLWLAWRYWRGTKSDIQTSVEKELRRRNLCPKCEYDLRGSVTRCPECGAPISSANIEI
jgi:hypothetical protein